MQDIYSVLVSAERCVAVCVPHAVTTAYRTHTHSAACLYVHMPVLTGRHSLQYAHILHSMLTYACTCAHRAPFVCAVSTRKKQRRVGILKDDV